MSESRTWFARLVDGLPETLLFQWIGKNILVPYWAWREPTRPLPGGVRPAIQPSDNLQNMMNLIMPLKDKSPIGRAKLVMALAQNLDEIYAGLDNVGTVHFARFIIVDDNLCMISVYDGDFSNYIRDFIATIGDLFDVIVHHIEGGESVIPCERNVEGFIAWVHARDLYQAPDNPTDLMVDWERANLGVDQSPDDDLRSLSRELVLQLNANPNISLGGGYRRYPGFSAAQVRKELKVGW
ncbi:MAG: hypothetical protein WAO69_05190 [Aestuariivita sp.]|uniref:hypothetical protein n=1 Tax=Aestuariivita sp. TaxID=1872407 RepID=UPI003BAF56C6